MSATGATSATARQRQRAQGDRAAPARRGHRGRSTSSSSPSSTRRPACCAALSIPFPDGLAPEPQPIDPPPDRNAPLPQADVVVVTWTVAELNALADVLHARDTRARSWYRYTRHFEDQLPAADPRRRAGAQGAAARQLLPDARSADTTVLCIKSELHLNQDGISTGDGTATLPVKDLFRADHRRGQAERRAHRRHERRRDARARPRRRRGHPRGEVPADATSSRTSRSTGKTYTSDWEIPTTALRGRRGADGAPRGPSSPEPEFGPPTKRYGFDGPPLKSDPPEQRRRSTSTAARTCRSSTRS